MTLTTDVYFELRFRATARHLAEAKLRLAEAELDVRTREYIDCARRAGLDPDKGYRFDDATLTLTEMA